jgi:hypothetical protein
MTGPRGAHQWTGVDEVDEVDRAYQKSESREGVHCVHSCPSPRSRAGSILVYKKDIFPVTQKNTKKCIVVALLDSNFSSL